MNKNKNFFRILLAVYFQSCAGGVPWSRAEDGITKEITSIFSPVGDGHITRIIDDGPSIYYLISGPGGAEGDSTLMETHRSDPSIRMTLLDLGTDSELAKEKHAWNANAELIAMVGKRVFLFNLLCGPAFPHPTPAGADTITGNLILFDARTRRFTNLTKCHGNSGKYNKAVRWFPKEGVILVNVYDREDKIIPAPALMSARPICFKLSDRSFHSLEKYATITKWYNTSVQLMVKSEMRSENGKDYVRRKVSNGTNAIVRTFDAESKGRTLHGVYTFALKNGLACAGNAEFGTFLIDFDGYVKNEVSENEAFCYDYETKQLFLRSRETDSNGENRYWVLNMDAYLNNLIQKLR